MHKLFCKFKFFHNCRESSLTITQLDVVIIRDEVKDKGVTSPRCVFNCS